MQKLSYRFEEALVYAAHLHAQQTRKGTHIPYMGHLLSVAALVIEDGGSEDEVIAALLHDAIEDQGGQATRDEILRRFGERVTEIVEGCTDTATTPKPPWKTRKEKYLAHLAKAPMEVIRVSTADKLHNLRSIVSDFRMSGHDLWKRFSAGRDEQLWFYQSFVTIVSTRTQGPLVNELQRSLDELLALGFADPVNGVDKKG